MTMYHVVSNVGRAWVSFYTAGMPEPLRDARRDEIASDLYEQRHEAAAAGGAAPALPVAGRFVRGIPADVSWRFSHEVAATHEDDITSSWPGRFAVAFILGLAVTSLVYTFVHAFGVAGGDRVYAIWNVAALAVTLLMLKGFAISKTNPLAGGALIVGSCLFLAMTWIWILPLALGVVVVMGFGVIRAYRFSREKRSDRHQRLSDDRRDNGPGP